MLLVGIALMACSGPDITPGTADSAAEVPIDVTTPPLVDPPSLLEAQLVRPLNPTVRLARRLQVVTDRPTTLSVDYADLTGEHQESVAFVAAGTDHDVALLGFRPARSYTVDLTVTDAEGLTASTRLEVQTDPLPKVWPQWTVRASDPSRMEPGLTLMSFRASGEGYEYMAILDAAGEVRWLQELTGDPQAITTADVRMLDNGELLATRNGEVIQLDLLGRLRHRLVPGGVKLAKDELGIVVPEAEVNFHHEVGALPDGLGALALATVPLDLDSYPVNYTDRSASAPATIADDLVLEVGWDGTVQQSWSLASILDPQRIGYDSLDRRAGMLDWAHANAVIYDEASDAYLVSARHQDAVVKIDRKQGELVWILGTAENWREPWASKLLRPVDEDMEWPFHTHASEVTPHGTVLLFDNHNRSAVPFGGGVVVPPERSVSRLVEYAIDEKLGTVEEVWAFSAAPGGELYASGMGDADWQPITGNVLGTWGLTLYKNGASLPSLGLGTFGVRILEVTHHEPPLIVFDLELTSDAAELPNGWTCNRAERVPTLYPPDVAVGL